MQKLALYVIFSLIFSTGLSAQDTRITAGAAEIPVTGLVDTPFVISIPGIQQFPVQEIKNFNITGPGGKIKRTIKSFKGVLLTDILAKAKITMPNEKDRGTYIILLTATDGYKVIFSYNELMFGPAGRNTFLVFEEGGKPIEKNGPFVAVCTSDVITGPRHVKWVKEIIVKKIND